ncbi:serine O-acetyltransferase [Peribacillus simplex]|uniref:serine O-acetyltransferase n=1 Tax=Peribacillus simplex TaxID=1478 RepID=UPI003D29B62F
MLVRYRYKYGIDLPPEASIGKGFYIGHFGGIFINGNAVLGDGCNISQDVTIGYHNGGSPKIGSGVYFAPGSKVFGPITIGNNVAIGANSVVNKTVPDNAIVVGIPGEVKSLNGNRKTANQ